MIGFPVKTTNAPAWPRRRTSPVFARGGMVATAHPLATSAGLRVLAEGGNAVDAIVAAGLVAGVVLPAMCGIGGDVFAIVHSPGDGKGETVALHGSGIGPRNTTIDHMRAHGERGGRLMPQQGPLSVAVPGAIDGYFALLDRFGTRSFAQLAEPAIGYAGDGFPIAVPGVDRIVDATALLSRYPSSASVFLPDGRPPAPGSILRQTNLAHTLRRIAGEGREVFYRGEIAARIGRFLAEVGGVLSAEDFADHRTEVAPPITTTYRGHTVYETCLPTQGFVLLESLNLVEGSDLATIGVATGAGIHLEAEALKLAFADRLRYAGDPAFVDTPLATLIAKEWASTRAARIDPARAAEDVSAGELRDGETTYLCAVDGNGMMVSLIQSLSAGFGSGVVAGDTGIVLNNRAGHCFSLVEGHPNLFVPGKKTMHTLNCYLIADPDGTPVLVGGTPGGDSQPQWNLQVITGLIDTGLDVQAAAELPRWSVWPGTYPIDVGHPFELRIEGQIGDTVIADLERPGHRVVRLAPWTGGSAVQLIARDPATGALAGGSDPRAEGLALGL